MSALASDSFQDPALEAELDAVIDTGFYPPDRSRFARFYRTVDQNTPVRTYARATSYRAFELAMADNDFEQAFALVDDIRQRATMDDGTVVDEVLLEALVTEVQLLFLSHDIPAAMSKVPTILLALETVDDPRLSFFSYHLIARIKQQNSQYEDALHNFMKAYDVITRTDHAHTDRRRIFLGLNIARIHAELRNDTAALTIAENAIELALNTGLHARLPDLYLVRGYIQGRDIPTDEALQSYYQAIEWAKQTDDVRARLVGINNAGSVLLRMERYSEARQVLIEGVESSEQFGRVRDADIMQFNLAYIDVLEGKYEQGLAGMEAATTRYREYARLAEVADWLEFMAHAYQLAGQYERQAQTLLEQRTMRESIFRIEREKALSELRLRYETEEKGQQIRLLQQQSKLQQGQLENQRLQQRSVMLLIVITLLTAALCFFAYRNARRTNEQLNKANQTLHDQSIHDSLTGLLNRRFVQQQINEYQARPGEKDALFLIDIDFFKQINDNYGHDGGDQVLVELASRLKTICRQGDSVVRWGGEEFLLVLRSVTNDDLPEFAQRLHTAVSGKPFMYQGSPVDVTATTGFITLPLDGLGAGQPMTLEKALQVADLLLYYGKSHGRNQITGIIAVSASPDDRMYEALLNDIERVVSSAKTTLVRVEGPPR